MKPTHTWFYVLAFLVPLMANAECNCDNNIIEEDDDAASIFNPYSYIGIKGGTSHLSAPTIIAGDALGYGAYWGSRYSQSFAVELDYVETGSFKTVAGTANMSAYSLSGIHQLSMGGMDLIGRLGLSYTSNSQNNLATAISNNGFLLDLSYGIGLEADLNRNLHFRLMYDRYRLNMNGIVNNDFANASFLLRL